MVSQNIEQEIDRTKKASFIKVRYIIIVLATLCPVVCYISRQNLSMAMVAMKMDSSQSKYSSHINDNNNNKTDNLEDKIRIKNLTQIIHNNNNNNQQQQQQQKQVELTCPIPLGNDGFKQIIPKTYGPKYDWEPSEISLIFEAFFITYVICQIPAARFSEIVGASSILLTATIGSSILSLLVPIAASYHPLLFALIRALMGICQSALYPACYVLYTRWLPPNERSQAIPVLMVGAFIGSIITSTLTGYLSELETFGWEYSYYIASFICAIWSILWLLLGSSEPRKHKFISLEELDYIETQIDLVYSTSTSTSSSSSSTLNKNQIKLKTTDNIENNGNNNLRTTRRASSCEQKNPSWSKLFKSQHIWAIIIAFFASNWSFTITLLLLPRYLNDILHVPPFKNGLINSIIFLLYCIGAPTAGSISTLMIQKNFLNLSSLTIRKIFQSIALYSQMICFLLIILFGCDTTLVLGTLYIQVVLYSFINGGEVQIPGELSNDFAGTIFAIGNCVGSATGFIIPRMQSILVPNTHIMSDWRIFFYLASFISLIGALVFMLFAKNDPQDFSKNSEELNIYIYRMSYSGEFNNNPNGNTNKNISSNSCCNTRRNDFNTAINIQKEQQIIRKENKFENRKTKF